MKKEAIKYLAVDRYKDYMTGKTKRVSVSMEKDTKQERNKAQRILSAKIEAARQADPVQKITLESLMDSYIAYQRNTLKESTIQRNEAILNIVIKIIGSDALCDRLTASIVMDRLLSTNNKHVSYAPEGNAPLGISA